MESEISLGVKCLVIFLCESVGLARRPKACKYGASLGQANHFLTHFASKTICSEREDAVCVWNLSLPGLSQWLAFGMSVAFLEVK